MELAGSPDSLEMLEMLAPSKPLAAISRAAASRISLRDCSPCS